MFAGNRLECDCRLAWMYAVSNETRNDQIRTMLKQLSCYMKAKYFAKDRQRAADETENELPNNEFLRRVIKDEDFPNPDNSTEEAARMLKLFSIPAEFLPCPEKHQPTEVLLERTSSDNSGRTSRANSNLHYRTTITAAMTTGPFIYLSLLIVNRLLSSI